MKRFVQFLSASALLLCGACSHVETSTEIKDKTKFETNASVSDQELQKTGEKYIHQVLDAMAAADYEKFREFFVKEFQQKLNKDQFAKTAREFSAKNGKLEKLQYLGNINKASCRILLWKATFSATPAKAEAMKKAGLDPKKAVIPEMMVQMSLGKTDKGWRILGVFML